MPGKFAGSGRKTSVSAAKPPAEAPTAIRSYRQLLAGTSSAIRLGLRFATSQPQASQEPASPLNCTSGRPLTKTRQASRYQIWLQFTVQERRSPSGFSHTVGPSRAEPGQLWAPRMAFLGTSGARRLRQY